MEKIFSINTISNKINQLKEWWRKLSRPFKVASIFIILVIFIFSYFFTFEIIKPFEGEITKGKPIVRKLCEMQTSCYAVVGYYPCSFAKKEIPGSLNRWKGYNGCSEETEGYFYYESNSQGGINIEFCHCGDLYKPE
jgi:energy-coupling factor transporter transmembrane protein EcfT